MKRLLKIGFFLLIFIFFTRSFEGNGDFYHHVNTGRYIVQNWSLPHLDDFSHTANGKNWVAHSWASGLIFYAIFELFGQVGISLFFALIATLTFFLLYVYLKSLNLSERAIFLAIALTAVVFSTRFPQRPEVFTYPLILIILLIDQFRKRYKGLSLLFPVVILFWASAYGSAVILGLGMIGLLTLKQFLIDGFKFKADQRLFYISAMISLPISYFNGYGFQTLLYFYFFIPKVAVYEGEWQGLWRLLGGGFHNYLLLSQYSILIYLSFALLFLLSLIANLRLILKHKFFLLLSVTIFAPLLTYRQVPLVAILISPMLAIILDSLFQKKRYILIFFVMFINISMLIVSLWQTPPSISKEESYSAKALVEYIKKNQLSGKAFNHIHFGGFLTYKLYPHVRVFYDTRDELYLETEAYQDLYTVYSAHSTVLPILKKYKIDLVIADIITDNLNYKDLIYSNDWAIVYFNDRYLLAVPASVAKEKNLQVINSIDPFSKTGVKGGRTKEAIDFYKSAMSQNPGSLNNHFYLASALISNGDADEALFVTDSMPKNQGPGSKLSNKDIADLYSQIYLKKAQKDPQANCGLAKENIEKTERLTKNALFFDLSITLPSLANRNWAIYYLVCQKDQAKANDFLEKYLIQPEVTTLEKALTQREFNQLMAK